MEYTMEEVDSRTQHELESRLRDALADLRKQHEEQTHIHREELEMLYESKVRRDNNESIVVVSLWADADVFVVAADRWPSEGA